MNGLLSASPAHRAMVQLIQVLQREQLDPNLEELADMLWLAGHIQVPHGWSTARLKTARPQPKAEAKPPKQTQPPASPVPDKKAAEQQPSKADSAALYAPGSHAKSEATKGGRYFRTPAVAMFPNALALGRALRPLIRTIPSRTRYALDEDATIERMAEEQVWWPVLRGVSERWLDLTVVVDRGHSMLLWQQSISEFCDLLKTHGAFHHTRIWHLDTDHTYPILSQGLYGHHEQPRDPRELNKPSRPAVMLVISDCVSPAWYNAPLLNTLKMWAQAQPLALVQMLPPRLWPGTALFNAGRIQVAADAPLLPNPQLKSTGGDVWLMEEAPHGLRLPVLTLEPESFANWSKLLHGKPGAILNSALLDPVFLEEPQEQISTEADARQRLRDFYAFASPVAKKLAAYFSAAPLNLAVMRMIQQLMLPESGQSHLAEVFLGGLLKRSNPEEIDPARLEYDFYPGVRDLLLETVPAMDIRHVLEKTSQYVSRHVGQSRDFQAVLRGDFGVGGVAISEEENPFAFVAAHVLGRLGGQYAGWRKDNDVLLEKKHNNPTVFVNDSPELRGVYGRGPEIYKLTKQIQITPILILHGIAGTGKSCLIKEICYSLGKKMKYNLVQIGPTPHLSSDDIFQQLAVILPCFDENPRVPRDELHRLDTAKFAKYRDTAKPCIVHISRAHTVFDDTGFIDPEVRTMLRGLVQQLPQFRVILESTQAAPTALFPDKLYHVHRVRGLGIDAVRAYFHHPFRSKSHQGWELDDEQAQTVYEHLGGKNPKSGAHPLYMVLLVRVADGLGSDPWQVLQRYPGKLYKELEETLFQDLYTNVLTLPQQHMLRLCALYRHGIPYQHEIALVQRIGDKSSFNALVQRFILYADEKQEYYYLDSLFADMVRQRLKIYSPEYLDDHAVIAEEWLRPVRGIVHGKLPHILAANEAAYHLLEAQQFERLQELSHTLLGGNTPALLEMWSTRLYDRGDDENRRYVLELLVALQPDNHKAHRFLGECIEKVDGRGTDSALEHYLKAYELNSTYPKYLANIGRCMLARKEARRFVALVDGLSDHVRDKAVDAFVEDIYSRCLERLDRERIVVGAANETISENLPGIEEYITIYLDLDEDVQTLLAKNSISIESIFQQQGIDVDTKYQMLPDGERRGIRGSTRVPTIITSTLSTLLAIGRAVYEVLNTLNDRPHFVEYHIIEKLQDSNGNTITDHNGEPILTSRRKKYEVLPPTASSAFEKDFKMDPDAEVILKFMNKKEELS